MPSFWRVLRLHYGTSDRRDTARLLMRLTFRLAGRGGDVPGLMRFRRSTTFAPDGTRMGTVSLVYDGRHHHVLPWRRLARRALRRLLDHHVEVFRTPDRVRWVFSGRWLARPARTVRQDVTRMLRGRGGRQQRQWIDALPRMVKVIA